MRQPRRRVSDQDRVLRAVPERDFMLGIIEAAEWLHWRCYHVNDSRRDKRGYPDVWMVGMIGTANEGRLLVLECKTEQGGITTDQLLWLADLEQVRTVEVHTVRPRDIDRVLAMLQARTEGEGE